MTKNSFHGFESFDTLHIDKVMIFYFFYFRQPAVSSTPKPS